MNLPRLVCANDAGSQSLVGCAATAATSSVLLAVSKTPVAKLTPTEIAELRHAVEHRQRYQPGVCYKPVLLVGGPLDGIPTRVSVSHTPGASIGWSTVTKDGLIVATYRLGEDNVWRFEECS